MHRLGGCRRLPGTHYLNFECLGVVRPLPEFYDDVCRQCWPVGAPGSSGDDETATDCEDDAEAEPYACW